MEEYMQARVHQTPRIYKIERDNQRYYTDLESVYPSVTAILKETMSMGDGLLKWYVENGFIKCRDILNKSSTYGTIFHIVAEQIILGQRLDLDDKSVERLITSILEVELTNNDNQSDAFGWIKSLGWVRKMQKDILSFIQWLQDYDVKPCVFETADRDSFEMGTLVAVEFPVIYRKPTFISTPRGQFAGTVDLVCTMNAKKYTDKTPKDKRKRVTMLVDFKTGGIWENHAYQLQMYAAATFQTYGVQVDGLANWTCKDWRSTPTYVYKDQTNEGFAWQEVVDLYAAKNGEFKLKAVKRFTGSVQFGGNTTAEVVVLDHEAQVKAVRDLYEPTAEQQIMANINSVVSPKPVGAFEI